MTTEQIGLGFIWYVVFLFSLTCHEAAHALVAKWGGDLTAAEGGQVTLNPLPHMQREIFGTLIVPILSYALGGWMLGWGSAPYDPRWGDRYPHRAAWMALAGPVANFILILVAALAIHVGIFTHAFARPHSIDMVHVVVTTHPGFTDGLAVLLSIMFCLNLMLFLFNLIPLPPLDGHGAICLLFKENFARRFTQATHNPTFAMIGLMACWKGFDYIYDPLFTMALNVLYPGAGYH